jgi:hypothetical protein
LKKKRSMRDRSSAAARLRGVVASAADGAVERGDVGRAVAHALHTSATL